ncbi:MAG: polysaccharide deacetylase family protein [Lachnospiraceae bacterium]|nr:polysaccharide deacetylase family protein [Lachnospiraceae bacterium]
MESQIRNRRRQRFLRRRQMGLAALLVLVVLLCNTAAAASKEKFTRVKVTGAVESMLQEAEIPALGVQVEVEGDEDTVLDEKTNMTVKDLAEQLKSGEGIELKCDADGVTEGEFSVDVKLSKELENALINKWLGKVQVYTKDGLLTVKNKYGEWDGNKFKNLEGAYVTESFIPSKGKMYYFDAEGNKVTGWQTIKNAQYLFNKEGVMQTGWQERDGAKYYLQEDGKAAVGWVKLEEDTYYFDREAKMVTGEKHIGASDCVFAKDGKLKSKESSLDLTRPMMALTFDDGPGERTMELLNVLEQYNSKATFFMTGTGLQNSRVDVAATVQKMEEIGCQIGNHTMSHPQLTHLDAAGIQAEIGGVNDLLTGYIGHGATILRPPYGAKNDEVRANAGMPLGMWSIDTLDWKTRNVQQTIDCIINEAGDGDIVLMHDIHTESIDAAIAAIPQLVDKGYQLVTIEELAEARGIALQNGEEYYSFYPNEE